MVCRPGCRLHDRWIDNGIPSGSTFFLFSYIQTSFGTQTAYSLKTRARCAKENLPECEADPSPPTSRGQLKYDGTRAETRFRLSAKRTSSFKSGGGRQFSRLLAAEVCASAVVMLDKPMLRGSVKSTGYPLHSLVSLSLTLPCVIVYHHISTGV